MEEKLKALTSKELVRIYRLILEHKEFLEKEKQELEGDQND